MVIRALIAATLPLFAAVGLAVEAADRHDVTAEVTAVSPAPYGDTAVTVAYPTDADVPRHTGTVTIDDGTEVDVGEPLDVAYDPSARTVGRPGFTAASAVIAVLLVGLVWSTIVFTWSNDEHDPVPAG